MSSLNFRLLAALLLPVSLWAQFETASILGTVRDSTGAVVPAVAITLRNTQTGISTTAQTDETGNYQFGNLRIGSYELAAEKKGFSKAVVQNIDLVVNARQRIEGSTPCTSTRSRGARGAHASKISTVGQVIWRFSPSSRAMQGRLAWKS